ncbi:glycosyltransferase family 4 protein [Aliivibrio wodanis]|uniref:glycosyltransferase family 4 protein n=1 Tax=Aliivibrio wodanis TaxID=80852 RepID=UPI00406D38F2
MKIVQVITRSDTIGGAQKYVLDVSKELKKDSHNITIISGSNGVFKEKACNEGIDFYGIDSLKRELSFFDDLKTLMILFGFLLKKRPDIVSLHSIKAGLLGRLACSLTPSTVYFTAHGWSHIRQSKGYKRKLYLQIERYLSKLCRKVICVSKNDMAFAEQVIGIKKDRLCLIQNGVKEIKNKKRAPGTVKLVSIVRFQVPKDFDTLLDSLYQIKDKAWELDILGDGTDIAKVRQKINHLGLANKVRLLGFKESVDEYYQNADAVVLISHSEGLPMSLLEGMSCSKLLIASDVGGIDELIIPEWNGFLIPRDDSHYLSMCITAIINSPEIIEQYGANSKLHFDSTYSFEKMYYKLLDLYKEE